MDKNQQIGEFSDSSAKSGPNDSNSKSTGSMWLTTRKSTPSASNASSAPRTAKKSTSIKNAPRVNDGPMKAFLSNPQKSDTQSAPGNVCDN